MITAAEAKELSKKSNKELFNAELKKTFERIEESAKEGFRNISILNCNYLLDVSEELNKLGYETIIHMDHKKINISW